MRNPDVLFIIVNKSTAEDMRRALGDTADVIHIETVPHYGGKRRYKTVFFQYPDDSWLDWKGFMCEHERFIKEFVGEVGTWLLPGGSISYL